MKHTLQTLATIMLFINVNGQIETQGEAINKAGKQRMYIMKMLKNYMAIGAGVKTDAAQKELEETSSLFNENYNDLFIYCKAKEVKDALTIAGNLWAKYREKINDVPNTEDAKNLLTDANTLVTSYNVVVEKLVKTSKSKAAFLPDMSGRQRMLSQKMAALYLAKYWKISSFTLNKDITDTINEYDNALVVLTNAAENTVEIASLIKLQQDEWSFVRKLFNISDEKMQPTSIYSSTNLMTRNFDHITGLYSKLIS